VTIDEALSYLRSLQLFGFKPGLESTRRLAALAGDPQRRLRFIHVAGTNGKGSTCALLESVYRATGLKVGLFTSPHLVRFGERIQVNRCPISDDTLARRVAELKNLAAGLEPTLFEFATVLALQHFAEEQVDLVIWETGLGGRWDATNIVDPLASVITNISLDHQAVLGNTLAAIASEKAGIIKPGIPVVTAVEDPDARAVIEFRARELDSPLIQVGTADIAAFPFELQLTGDHQKVNAAVAATTVRLLRYCIPVNDTQLQQGLETANWPGRFQTVVRGPQTLVLDGAHNPAGVAALASTLARQFLDRRPVLIVGLLSDKDWRSMVRQLVPLASRIITAPVSSERTVGPEELRAACVATGKGRPVRAAGSLTEALKWTATDSLVLITGSLYFVGEAMEQLGLEASDTAGERALNHWSPPTR
jgi:dihydrofolate synthase/folylpolyglutamate synthase